MTNYPALYLKKREERRVKLGHPWVFSNEVDTKRSPLKNFTQGELVTVVDSNDRAFAVAYVNAASLICARIVSQNINEEIDVDWFVKKITEALILRDSYYEQPYYRMVFGEGDGLPGVVIDRYNDVLVVQITTAGAERWKSDLTTALQQLLEPVAIVWRNDSKSRELEKLPLYTETTGNLPKTISVQEGSTEWALDLENGQKTGWFFDQRSNRNRFKAYANFYRGGRVLDIYSYVGAWGLAAAEAGAAEITCVDRSELALGLAQETADKQNVNMHCLKGDTPEILGLLKTEQHQFDAVVIDPPALIKTRKSVKAGSVHYAQVNEQAMQLVKPGGLFVSASCSYHLPQDELRKILLKAASKLGRSLQILEYGELSPDHPVHPALPEMRYLKAFYCRVL